MGKDQIQANVRMSQDEAELLMHLSWSARTPLEVVQELLAEGIRSRMSEHSKPVSKRFLDVSFPWTNIMRCLEEFLDAVSRDAGTVGTLGSTHRFVPVPDGCEFSDPAGKQVYIVLHDRWNLGSNGSLICRQESAQ